MYGGGEVREREVHSGSVRGMKLVEVRLMEVK